MINHPLLAASPACRMHTYKKKIVAFLYWAMSPVKGTHLFSHDLAMLRNSNYLFFLAFRRRLRIHFWSSVNLPEKEKYNLQLLQVSCHLLCEEFEESQASKIQESSMCFCFMPEHVTFPTRISLITQKKTAEKSEAWRDQIAKWWRLDSLWQVELSKQLSELMISKSNKR